MKPFPKVLLSAPMGVQPYLTPALLNEIDPGCQLGLALTCDVLKYKPQQIHSFISQPGRFVLIYPENSRRQKSGYLVQTSTSQIQLERGALLNLGADCPVSFN